MSCALHKIGFRVTENIIDALSSPKWADTLLSQPSHFQKETHHLLEKAQDTRRLLSKAYEAPPGEIPKEIYLSLSRDDEQTLEADSQQLDRVLSASKDIHAVFDIAWKLLAIINHAIAQSR